MDRKEKFQAEEAFLKIATEELSQAIASVKDLSKSAERGTASKAELERAMNNLVNKKRKVEILSAKTKMLGGFSSTGEVLPREKFHPLWLLSVIVSLYILFSAA